MEPTWPLEQHGEDGLWGGGEGLEIAREESGGEEEKREDGAIEEVKAVN